MFRKFGIVEAIGDGSADNVIRTINSERLINLSSIVQIYIDHSYPDELVTRIELCNGEVLVSEIGYEHLAATLDGYRW